MLWILKEPIAWEKIASTEENNEREQYPSKFLIDLLGKLSPCFLKYALLTCISPLIHYNRRNHKKT